MNSFGIKRQYPFGPLQQEEAKKVKDPSST